MADNEQLSSLELAALLCSRVCHDVISPVGAITNGLEVLDEDGAEDMREFAMDLIRKSAQQASAKLQFCRIAFGAAGSAGAEIDLGDAEKVAQGFMAGEKPDLVWQAPTIMLPKDYVKLILNLLLVALSAVPRGGTVTVTVDPATPRFRLSCSGPNARVPAGMAEFIDYPPTSIDAHGIQPVYTGMLARQNGLTVRFAQDGDTVTVVAEPA